MRRQAVAGYAGLAVVAAAAIWALFVWLPHRYGPAAPASVEAPVSAPDTSIRKIKARLFFVSGDGSRLVAVEQDVPFGEGVIAQARVILEAQLAPPAPPLALAIPAGTKLRTLFVTERGEAFVDLSAEISTRHPGGSLNEICTVYTIVNVLTANLPAITAVQILVNGQEVDTLAGHVDLRRPLQQDLRWVDASRAAPQTAAGNR